MKAQGKQYSEGAACFALVINKYTKMYLKCLYFMPSILQIHIYVLNINTLQLYFWYTKLVYLKD